jgi:hypothetical protein
MTDELELAYEFYREGNSQQKNEQYSSIANHIEQLNSRICSQMKETV